jgi:hypothetical protein
MLKIALMQTVIHHATDKKRPIGQHSSQRLDEFDLPHWAVLNRRPKKAQSQPDQRNEQWVPDGASGKKGCHQNIKRHLHCQAPENDVDIREPDKRLQHRGVDQIAVEPHLAAGLGQVKRQQRNQSRPIRRIKTTETQQQELLRVTALLRRQINKEA